MQRARQVLRENDGLFTAVHDALLAEMQNPSKQPYVGRDGVKRRVLLLGEQLLELMKKFESSGSLE